MVPILVPGQVCVTMEALVSSRVTFSYHEPPFHEWELQIENMFKKMDEVLYSGFSNRRGAVTI
jgi:hypothetical protein